MSNDLLALVNIKVVIFNCNITKMQFKQIFLLVAYTLIQNDCDTC